MSSSSSINSCHLCKLCSFVGRPCWLGPAPLCFVHISYVTSPCSVLVALFYHCQRRLTRLNKYQNSFLQQNLLSKVDSSRRRPQYFDKWKTTLILLENGRRPQYFGKWKLISKFSKWKTTSTLWQMKDDLYILKNVKLPTSIFWQLEDYLNV